MDKKISLINFIVSCVLWLLGILTLIFNALGMWKIWHLSGILFFVFIPIPTITLIISLLLSYLRKDYKLLLKNLIIFLISLAIIIFTYFVSATWFW